MPYKYNLSQEAEDDMLAAYIWYETQRAGLGEEFLDALDKARQVLLLNPAAYSARYKEKIRAFLVDRFPYLILYVLEKKEVNVIYRYSTRVVILKSGKRGHDCRAGRLIHIIAPDFNPVIKRRKKGLNAVGTVHDFRCRTCSASISAVAL